MRILLSFELSSAHIIVGKNEILYCNCLDQTEMSCKKSHLPEWWTRFAPRFGTKMGINRNARLLLDLTRG